MGSKEDTLIKNPPIESTPIRQKIRPAMSNLLRATILELDFLAELGLRLRQTIWHSEIVLFSFAHKDYAAWCLSIERTIHESLDRRRDEFLG